MQLVQGGGDAQAQVVQPCLVDHGELGDGEDGVVLGGADAGGAHLLGGGQAVDAAVGHGDGGADVRVFIQDLRQVGHGLLVDVLGQVDEGAILAIGGQVIVGEAHAHEGVRQLAGVQLDVDLLGQGVAHGVPMDGDAHVLLELVEHFVVVIAGGQRGLGPHDVELGLVFVGGGTLAAAGGQRPQHHGKGQDEAQDSGLRFHFHSSICLKFRCVEKPGVSP